MKTSPFHSLQKFRFYTAINILGLALSLACTMLLVRYIYAELTVDHYNPDLDRLALLTEEDENGIIRLGSGFKNHDENYYRLLNRPQVEAYATYVPWLHCPIRLGQSQFIVNALFTDSMFLKITHYPLLAGDGSLSKPGSAILSTALARKVFGNTDPLGKTFIGENNQIHTVTGVLGEPFTKSSLQVDMLIPRESSVRSQMTAEYPIIRLKSSEFFNELNKEADNTVYQFIPFKKIYFDKSLIGFRGFYVKGSLQNVWVLSIAASLLFILGIFNFINIYSVVMLKRAREFGLRRLFGINKKGVYLQLWKENLMITALALFIAWCAMEIMEVMLARIFLIQLIPNLGFDLLLSVGILLLLPLLTTVFPWIRFCRSSALISIRSVNTGGQSMISRKVFLFSQYMITYGLIIVSLFFVRQINFALNYDYGYQLKDIIQGRLSGNRLYDLDNPKDLADRQKLSAAMEAFYKDIDGSPLFIAWEADAMVFSNFGIASVPFQTPEGNRQICAAGVLSQKQMDMYKFQLKEGRIWDPLQDNKNDYKIIINATAKKIFGIKDIENAQLLTDSRFSNNSSKGLRSYQVIGVIEDFRVGHLSEPIVPVVIAYRGENNMGSLFSVHIAPGKKQEAISFLTDWHKKLTGSSQFEYTSFEDEMAKLYAEDRKVATIYSSFALIAILVSAMGLFGLSLFDIRQRYREIALRKVNGATFKDIRKLLFIKYMRLLLLSFAVAAPIAYLFLHRYLQDYATHASISWWIFAVAAMLTMAVAMLTLLWQVQKASMLNPAEAIRTE